MRYLDKPLAAYSAWSNSPHIVLNSSSGGMFSEIAVHVTNSGGKVAGSQMRASRPHHIVSDRLEDVARMRGSKYIQSKTLSLFSSIVKSAVASPFLFSGTPCQVAAVKNLWSFHNYDPRNLITCDLVCHGVPSYLLFDRYVQQKTKKQKIGMVDFRNKSSGWRNYSLKISFRGGTTTITNHKKDIFMRSFLADVGLRESCYRCIFSRIPRVGDITLGDFWGVPAGVANEMGTSAILVNSGKGMSILEKVVRQGRITINIVDFHEIARKNRRVVDGYTKIPAERNEFLETLLNAGLPTAYRKFVVPILLRNRIRGAYGVISSRIKSIGASNG
jgi:coenzyme F420-reducing hydrogenase beta subunit